jgi:hypothetical protein
MNLLRLRELAKAGKDGTITPEELKELFEALPEVLAHFAPETCKSCNGTAFDDDAEICQACERPYAVWCSRCGSCNYLP